MNEASYALGMNIGQQLNSMGVSEGFSVEDFAAAIKDTLEGKKPQITPQHAQEVLQQFFAEAEQRQQAAAAEKGKAAKADGERFLAENAKKEGVTVTKSGLQYTILQHGDPKGRHPKATETVRCHYHGMLIDGTVFDNSVERGEPCEFGLNQVIAGWTEGVQLMVPGDKFRFFIPYQLAYGERGAGGAIPPYAALIFDVELLKVM